MIFLPEMDKFILRNFDVLKREYIDYFEILQISIEKVTSNSFIRNIEISD